MIKNTNSISVFKFIESITLFCSVEEKTDSINLIMMEFSDGSAFSLDCFFPLQFFREFVF